MASCGPGGGKQADGQGCTNHGSQAKDVGDIQARAVAANPFLFAGQYLDPTSGLYYMRARWYDPATAQFLTVDPLVAVTGQPYAYVGGDPVNAVDAWGLQGGASILTWAAAISFDEGAAAVCGAGAWIPIADVVDCGAVAIAAGAVTATAVAVNLPHLGSIQQARQSRKSGKQKKNDIPSYWKPWAGQHPPAQGESIGEWIGRGVEENNGSSRDASQIKKWLEQGSGRRFNPYLPCDG